jgi:hypothetical protein
LSLSLLRNSALILLLSYAAASADTFQIQDFAYIPRNVTVDEACEAAKINAQKQAMSKAGLEKGRFADLEICTDDAAGANCSLIQESQSYYEGGYITATKFAEPKIEENGVEKKCVIDAQITVERFKGNPDPNFALSAELSDRKMFANQTFSITGETTKEAYVYLLGYLPMKDEFYRIIPNRFEPMSKLQGEFIFPSKNSNSKYALEALLPKDFENDQLSEIMLVLATKDEFSLLNKETAPDFYKRLNELGRDQWRKIHLGYTIVRK